MLIENLLYRQKASEIYTQLENDFFSEGFQFQDAFSGDGDIGSGSLVCLDPV